MFKNRFYLIALAFVTVNLAGCMMLARRPDQSEFGFGPRASTTGAFVATLEPETPFVKKKLQRARLVVRDKNGELVRAAQVTLDGGMPQHGHGLPTRPRVTRNLGDGIYDIDGVRFNMGGWWEFKVAIAGKAGNDTVTFNFAL